MAERAFTSLAPLERARALLTPVELASETVPLQATLGRLLAHDVLCPRSLPSQTLAARDGYAVIAAETEGASAYNPLPLAASLVVWGAPMPPGTNAVLPFDAVEVLGPAVNALAPIAAGEGVAAEASTLGRGATAVPAGTVLRPAHLALLAAMGAVEVAVRRRPTVALLVAGPKGTVPDALTPMLTALIQANGGLAHSLSDLAACSADLLILAGRSGLGSDDDAPQTLRAAGGELLLHGVAIRPGSSAGVGRLNTRPVLLLAGDPLAALAAWHFLAGPLLRAMTGRPAPTPRSLPLRRKLVSAIGLTDLIPVRIERGEAMPLGPVDAIGPALAARSDGFVIVPATLEGYAAGDRVEVFPAA